jgi:conjugal transfer pilus assembly protein TraB
MNNKLKNLQEKFTNYCSALNLELRGSYKKIITSLKGLSSRATTTQSSNAAGLLNTQVESISDSIKAKRTHSLMTKGFFALGIAVLLLLLYYARQNDHPKEDKEPKAPLKLEIASQALDIDKMWRNHFEDKLIHNKSVTETKMQELQNTLDDTTIAYQNQLKAGNEALNAKIKFLTDELFSTRAEVSEIKLKSKATQDIDQAHNEQITQSRINVNDMGRGEVFDRPKSSRNFIPETAYVKGILLGGISVSTALGSSVEPVPVVIKVTERGSLPKNFNINLKHCQIMGSSYGDLSSERAIIRAEVLSCQDPKQELIYTTKIAGIIHGDDGMNGIKGKVVQTSGRHLKNAMIGSMISGFASSAKGQDQFSITSFGGINTQKKGMGTMVQEGSLTGASNAAEKLADYYIKQAEAMSPVLMVPGGVQVDVVFTKGVYLGARDVQEKLEQIRNSKGEKK